MKQGMRLPTYDLITIQEKRIFIPDGHHTVHLQFRRFAGCPICKLHLQTIAQRHQELVQANIIEVVVFHSASAILRQHVHNLPFAVVADPDKKLYHAFGVETSWRSVGDPRAWPSILRGLARFGPGREPGESVLGLPADFLISPNGELMACKYGAHADDHWSVDEILERSCGSLLGPAKPSCA
jgi:peroxiredoxin